MSRESALVAGVFLVVCVLGGVIFTCVGKDRGTEGHIFNPASAPSFNSQQQIKILQAVLVSKPDNRQVWVQLGNNFFDPGEPMKVIEAYDKALEIDGNDPDVLTDQGILYRRIGWFERFIANFTRANELDPGHAISLFNMGDRLQPGPWRTGQGLGNLEPLSGTCADRAGS